MKGGWPTPTKESKRGGYNLKQADTWPNETLKQPATKDGPMADGNLWQVKNKETDPDKTMRNVGDTTPGVQNP